MTLPEPAELARTSVARARVATLLTYLRLAPTRPHLTCVTVSCDGDGRPVVLVAPGSAALVHLLARPLASVRVAPDGGETVTVHGAVQRLRSAESGRLAFRVEVGAVLLGAVRPVTVEADAYRAAEPDPLLHEAPGVLAHLREAHTEELAACLRALGHDAQWVEPTALDRHGLTVLAVGLEGLATIRLAFPEPVRRLQDLRPGLGAVLLCRCSGRSSTLL